MDHAERREGNAPGLLTALVQRLLSETPTDPDLDPIGLARQAEVEARRLFVGELAEDADAEAAVALIPAPDGGNYFAVLAAQAAAVAVAPPASRAQVLEGLAELVRDVMLFLDPIEGQYAGLRRTLESAWAAASYAVERIEGPGGSALPAALRARIYVHAGRLRRSFATRAAAVPEGLPGVAPGPRPNLLDPAFAEGLSLISKGYELLWEPAGGAPQDMRGYLVESARSTVPLVTGAAAGIGYERAHRIAELCRDVLARVGDWPGWAHAVSGDARVLRDAQRPDLAEPIYLEALANANATPPMRAEFAAEHASTLSEMKDFEAADIAFRRLQDTKGDAGPAGLTDRGRATLHLNHANVLASLWRHDEAVTEYAAAIAAYGALKEPPQDALAQTRILMAEQLPGPGDPDAVVGALEAARPAFEQGLDGDHRLQFLARSARLLERAGQTDAAERDARAALELMTKFITRPSSPAIWEGMLQRWRDLPAQLIRAAARSGDPARAEEALLMAELAKGRVLEWALRGGGEAAAAEVLELGRLRPALAAARAWAAAEPGRAFLSLFADDEGVAVTTLDAAGLTCAWIDDARYTDFRRLYVEPLAAALEGADPASAYGAAGAIVDGALRAIGDWIARAAPRLQAGDTLVVSPHRALRNLPAAQAMMPGAAPLAARFRGVATVPSLAAFDAAPAATLPSGGAIWSAVVDPFGDLAFARLEGAAAAPGRLAAGAGATIGALEEAFATCDALLLSCHGDFDEADPARSRLLLADGAVTVGDIFTRRRRWPGLIVLGACESGRHRASMSDEPVGFANLLLAAGARAVLAPLWKVDDLASYLFLTDVFARMGGGAELAAAVNSAAQALRATTAEQVYRRLGEVAAGAGGAPELESRLAATRTWLRDLGADGRPFAAPTDWAAYQLHRGAAVPPA